MTERLENYLFGGLEQAYKENYQVALEALTQIKNKGLLQKAREIVRCSQITSDDIKTEAGPHEEKDTLVITVAVFEYGDMIKIGETVIKKSTPWFEYEVHEVDGRQVPLLIQLESIEFTRSTPDGLQSRPGPVSLNGKLADTNGITADFPLARLLQGKDEKVNLLYHFGNIIADDSDDYKKVEAMIISMYQEIAESQ